MTELTIIRPERKNEIKPRQKVGQVSQRLQGGVKVLELGALLRAKFPHHIIEPIPKRV